MDKEIIWERTNSFEIKPYIIALILVKEITLSNFKLNIAFLIKGLTKE